MKDSLTFAPRWREFLIFRTKKVPLAVVVTFGS